MKETLSLRSAILGTYLTKRIQRRGAAVRKEFEEISTPREEQAFQKNNQDYFALIAITKKAASSTDKSFYEQVFIEQDNYNARLQLHNHPGVQKSLAALEYTPSLRTNPHIQYPHYSRVGIDFKTNQPKYTTTTRDFMDLIQSKSDTLLSMFE